MKKLLENFEGYSLWVINNEKELRKLSEFVLRVNYKHHLNKDFCPADELQKLYSEDMAALPTSNFYVVYDSKGDLVGAIKSQKWNGQTILPIEKDFNISINNFIGELIPKPHEVIHIGRFAIDQIKIRKCNVLKMKRVAIMKMLLFYALRPVCNHSSNVVFCESDEKLYSKLSLLGVYSKIIGEPKVYLGSKTLPIYSTESGVLDFINQNRQINYV